MTDTAHSVEAASPSLANIILSLNTGTSEAESLKKEAVRIFHLKRPFAN